jgi:cation diffusion facilitator CzcD-associated flavoprotein CzcO
MRDDTPASGDDGEPLDEGRPEWETVEEERDYWKALALEYGAKLKAIEHTMKATWTVEFDGKGDGWVVQTDGDTTRRAPLASLEETLKRRDQ